MMKTYRVQMKYIFKDCDYLIQAHDKHEALELAKQKREAEWEQTLAEVAAWQDVPFPHESDDTESDGNR